MYCTEFDLSKHFLMFVLSLANNFDTEKVRDNCYASNATRVLVCFTLDQT